MKDLCLVCGQPKSDHSAITDSCPTNEFEVVVPGKPKHRKFADTKFEDNHEEDEG